MRNRRGQEEMVGFVLIIVIIAIAILVFLGISVRQGSVQDTKDSVDVYQFLESSMEYTSDCAIGFVPDYASIGELFRECRSGNNCLEGGTACGVLQESLEDILARSWNVGEDNPIKSYELNSYHVSGSDGETSEEIISVASGECAGSFKGATYITPAFPGKIRVELKLCS